MAYKTTINKSCANRAAALAEIWIQLAAMGWTLHDNMDASSYRVYKSNHEDGDRLYQYIKIQWTTANAIGFIAYYWWNSTTHAGLGAANSANELTVTTAETGFYLWLWGNKSMVFVMTKVSTTYYNGGFGHLPKRYWTTPETALTQNAASGSSVTINVASTAGFVGGTYYQIVGAGGEGRDRVLVSSVTNGTQMVISSLPRAYNTGAVIGICPIAFGIWNTTLAGFYLTCNLNAIGTGNSSVSSTPTAYINTANCIPDCRAQKYVLSGYVIEEATASYTNIVGYIDALFYSLATTGQNAEDVFGINEIDTGTSSGSNTMSALNDTSKVWTINAHANKVCIIRGGLAGAVGQIAKIASNTATQLVTAAGWEFAVVPDATSMYAICDEAYRYIGNGRLCQEGI